MPKATKAAPVKKAETKKIGAAGGTSKAAAKKTGATTAKKAVATKAPVKKAPAATKAAKAATPTKATASKAPAKKAPVAKKAPATKATTNRATKASTPTAIASKKATPSAPAPKKVMATPQTLPPKRPGAPTPVAKKAPGPLSEADKKFFAEQKQLLLEERDSYEQQAAALKAEADQLAAEMEPGDVQFDEESGEGDSIGMERERDLQLAGQARAAIEEIDRALAKIAAGTYGICERCNQPIPKARLKALPYAALCVACKSGGLSSRR